MGRTSQYEWICRTYRDDIAVPNRSIHKICLISSILLFLWQFHLLGKSPLVFKWWCINCADQNWIWFGEFHWPQLLRRLFMNSIFRQTTARKKGGSKLFPGNKIPSKKWLKPVIRNVPDSVTDSGGSNCMIVNPSNWNLWWIQVGTVFKLWLG